MKKTTHFKIRKGRTMPLVGTPLLVTTTSEVSAEKTFVESYVFLPIPRKLVWRRALVSHGNGGDPTEFRTLLDLDEFIFDQARIDYDQFYSTEFPDLYRELYYRRQPWDGYTEEPKALLQLYLRGCFERELKAIASSTRSDAFRDELNGWLRLKPIRIEFIHENLD